jgi:hypothetical protein
MAKCRDETFGSGAEGATRYQRSDAWVFTFRTELRDAHSLSAASPVLVK